MNDVVRRKLNILIYLAKVDGKFHKSEKALLMDFVNENKLDPKEFKLLVENPEEMAPEKIVDKEEMMFLALKVMKADKEVHETELEFCKELAGKLGVKPGIVDEFVNKELTREAFDKEVGNWL